MSFLNDNINPLSNLDYMFLNPQDDTPLQEDCSSIFFKRHAMGFLDIQDDFIGFEKDQMFEVSLIVLKDVENKPQIANVVLDLSINQIIEYISTRNTLISIIAKNYTVFFNREYKFDKTMSF